MFVEFHELILSSFYSVFIHFCSVFILFQPVLPHNFHETPHAFLWYQDYLIKVAERNVFPADTHHDCFESEPLQCTCQPIENFSYRKFRYVCVILHNITIFSFAKFQSALSSFYEEADEEGPSEALGDRPEAEGAPSTPQRPSSQPTPLAR